MKQRNFGAILALTLFCSLVAAPAFSQVSRSADALRTIAPAQSNLTLDARVVPIRGLDAAQIADGKLPIGAEIGFKVDVSKPARVYIVTMNADGEIRVIFPNEFDSYTVLQDAGSYEIPGKGMHYSFKISGPKGIDLIKVLAVAGDYSTFEDMLWAYFDQQESFPRSIKPTADTVDALQQFFKSHGSLVWAEQTIEFEIADK